MIHEQRVLQRDLLAHRLPRDEPAVERVQAAAYTIATERPESDGTLEWDSTTMVLARASGGGRSGLGFTYSHAAAAGLIETRLAAAVEGLSAMSPQAAWEAMRHSLRNIGARGVGMHAVSAVDLALWDLKAKLLEVPLARLLGMRREAVEAYGSGGFTSYSEAEVVEQLGGWVSAGLRRVKMKIGRDPERDLSRVAAVRAALGDDAGLMVDANGAFAPQPALAMGTALAELGVAWFEEPVEGDDVASLRLLRERLPPPVELAAGEYCDTPDSFRPLVFPPAVHVLQADATRCGGVTGFLLAAGLCESEHVPLSAHTSPAMHLHVCCCAPRVRHVEYFHDHVRIEEMLLEGVRQPEGGVLRPDPSSPGHGVELREHEAERYRVR